MSETALQSAPLLVVISAPSGAGKTTVCQNVLAANPGMHRAVTCTTRPPRAGERDGVDYHFLSREAFERRVAGGEFLEHATVYENRYGTLKSEVLNNLRAGRDVLLNIDVQGAASVRRAAAADGELAKALVTVFLTPPSRAVLEARLRSRGSESEEALQRRLKAARRELAEAPRFDYVLISGTMEEDLARMLCLLRAERMRSSRVRIPEL